ncbi:MAG TPA: polysaccharide biosynthesis/export family protein [Tepidisphaeraceae bacterium]|nr:polysaccharide biosynthesis/export family protein [Tepidisphaeraceae bacterium]
MRSALSPVSPKLALVACLAATFAAGGCETKSFLNPSEVGRFEKRRPNDPLLLPIVSTLETGVEEPNDQFANATDVQPDDLVAAQQDYVVGRNDLLSISITDLVGPGVETIRSVRVSESGNVSLPLIGQVRAEGLTEAQLETEIQRAYREANLMPNAQVSVTVAQALARTFSIIGSVNRPGQYGINQADFRVLDALVTAGDINSQGIDYLFVVRRADLAPRRPESLPPAGAPGAAPGGAPGGAPGTTPAPGTDVLQPRSQGPIANEPVYLLQDAATAPIPPSLTPPTSPAPGGGSSEGRYIIVDGKPVLVGNQGATATGAAPGAAAAAPVAPADPGAAAAAPPTTPAVAPVEPTTPGVAAPQGFDGFRNPMSADNTRVIRVPVTQLKNGDLRYNIVVKPQDMIIVPPPTTGEYYMDGHVNRTGVYSLTARQITLQQALAAAGGMDQLAIPARTEIVRRIGQDRQVFARVDLDKIASGEQPDIFLKPNDIVRVGTNLPAPFLAAFRNAFRITYGFGFLYDRNYAPQNNGND